MIDATVIWDDEDDRPCNVTHIADNGITVEEVEELILDDSIEIVDSRSSGRPSKIGWTSTGKHIFVVYDILSEDPMLIYPVTAYEIDP